MEKRPAGPILIRFKDRKEVADYTIKMELKYFIMKLLHTHYNQEV